MATELEVDGSFFTFEDGWRVERLDQWGEPSKLTRQPFESKGCDFVALFDDEMWLVESKDYTYPEARMPANLADEVSKKVFHTLAILHAVAHWGTGEHQRFSKDAVRSQAARLCLAVELKDGGRGLQGVEKPLADLRDKLRKATRPLNVPRPVVSNSRVQVEVPWSVRRDPKTRASHADR